MMALSLMFVILASLLISCMSECMQSSPLPYMLLDPPPAVDIDEHPVPRQHGDEMRCAAVFTVVRTPLGL